MRARLLVAVGLSLSLHAGLLLTLTGRVRPAPPGVAASAKLLRATLLVRPIEKPVEPPQASHSEPTRREPTKPALLDPYRRSRAHSVIAANRGVTPIGSTPVAIASPTVATPENTPATIAAPPAPTDEEWKLASTYSLKNSKRYRYNWGQQVRSMMGTAAEGPQQGHVRFLIEIAPDGKLTRVETQWSTSEIAEILARKAIESLPPLPPTPTGQPLVFEQTIAFVPYESGWPPIYKYDCLPDPPKFRNPFVWDGISARPDPRVASKNGPPASQPKAHEDCPNDTQPDSIEAEAADIKRQFDFWGSRPVSGSHSLAPGKN
ncbi:MAG: energy transducer TonB [Burkholderiaceae bacterium]|nr:energy transducer TonB [Burkholderiaceae bacterium]